MPLPDECFVRDVNDRLGVERLTMHEKIHPLACEGGDDGYELLPLTPRHFGNARQPHWPACVTPPALGRATLGDGAEQHFCEGDEICRL